MDGQGTNKWLITASVMLPTLMEILDTSVANVALPHIQGSLSAGQDEVTWVLTSYLVSNAVVIPMSGWLAKVLGRRRYLIGSIILFGVSSILCGAATSLTEIILFRVIQGVGGGGLQPMSQAILLETFPSEQRGMAMGIFGMGIVLGPILGPMVGGYLTDNWSWRWIFYINVPLSVLAVFLISMFVFDPEWQKRQGLGEAIDYVGIALLVVGLGCLQVVLDKGQRDNWFSSDFITTSTVISVVSLATFVFWELQQERPIVDLRIFKDRSFATGNAVTFFAFFAFMGSIVLLPLYVQTVMGYTALLAGLVLGPGGAITLVTLPLAGRLTQRLDARMLLGFGLVVSAYSCYYMSGFNGEIDFHSAIMGRVIQGVGMPFIFVCAMYVTMANVSNEQMNNASGIFNLLRNLGGSFGIAFVTTLLQWRSQFHQHRLVSHMTETNPVLSEALQNVQSYLQQNLGSVEGSSDYAGRALYNMLLKQVTVLAFDDVFYALGVIFFSLVTILWIIHKPPIGKSSQPTH